MADQPRKHHYVPQFYLAGFTDDGTVNGSLHVTDRARQKTWPSNPKNAAHQRDFHKIEGTDPMIVEKLLGQFEGKWSCVLRMVLDQRSLPIDDTFDDLMMFIAFMAVRVPRIRETISGFLDDVRREQEFARKWLEQQGHQVQQTNENKFDEFDQTWHVQQIVQMAASLKQLLSLRKWCLWIADDDAPDLICSDSPVAATWPISMPGPIPPAFGTPNTIVSVPLNRRLVLVSMIEEELPQIPLNRETVAAVNSMTATYANQLYSSEPDFVWRMKDGGVGNAANLLDALSGD